jgi:hypothetical protein
VRAWLLTIALLGTCLSVLWAQEPAPTVVVNDRGVNERLIGPGAPEHTIGLTGLSHLVDLDTGKVMYTLHYVSCKDPQDPKAAIPGEGYIGMAEPANCNWYNGGFFDLEINGQSLGRTMIHSLTVRSVADRGVADFVFDTPQAVVRVRFVAQAGGDCLYTQAFLEPKVEIKSLHLMTRCYPSAFVSNSDRHVTTPTRDLRQGEKAELDLAKEWWTFYYDSVYDAGYLGPTYKGLGPCAMLWAPQQTEKAWFTVGAYGIDTHFTLKPGQRDFRFVFFDFAHNKNADALASLRGRGEALLQELTSFQFTDPSLANWSLPAKQEELRQMLTAVPDDKTTAATYAEWAKRLEAQLQLVKASGAGSIMAEAEAAKLIGQWEKGLPELKLQALLNGI